MAEELCPYCGKPKVGTVSSFDCCPGHSDGKTDPGIAPNMEATPDAPSPSPVTPTSGFTKIDLTRGTKLSAGTRVGEYQIQERIGEGGMGTVYSAVHPIIGKKVAIKVLAGRLAKNKNAIRRFVLEARAVNDIRHPGLVDIFSFGQLTDGRHYYVMEYLAGRDLGDVLRERMRLPMSEVIPIFTEVSNALVAVHSKGIVHRDLKPENILLLTTPQPGGQRVKLVDFGLAKLVEDVPASMREGAPHTAAGVNVGTPHYMSPEQCRGLKVDARADLYALGVMFYETLTGRLPFDGATPIDIWQAHAEKAPQPPIEVVPGAVSAAVNAIILRLLAKQPEHRFQTAAALCTALGHLTEDGHAKPSAGPMHVGEAYDELAATMEDLPAITPPPVLTTEEERRREIEELRANLGLRIEEPATADQATEQMSALVIDLGPARAPAGDVRPALNPAAHSLQLPTGSTKPLQVRHIEERKRVVSLPPLAPPAARQASARTSEPPVRGSEVPALRPVSARTAEPPARGADAPARAHRGRIVRVAIVAALLVAATVVAIAFTR